MSTIVDELEEELKLLKQENKNIKDQLKYVLSITNLKIRYCSHKKCNNWGFKEIPIINMKSRNNDQTKLKINSCDQCKRKLCVVHTIINRKYPGKKYCVKCHNNQ